MKKRLDRVSLSDVARETGYSRGAVSLALRDHPSIPQSTCECIKAAAKRLNYRPNPLIAKLATDGCKEGQLPYEKGWAIVNAASAALEHA